MRFAFALLLVLTGFSSLGRAGTYTYVNGNFAWPYNTTYSFGIKPNPTGAGAAADAATLRSKYEAWMNTVRLNVSGCGTPCYRIQETNGANAGWTFSEGISYGMLLAVYMGDQDTFNGLWRYKVATNTSRGLMNWRTNAPGNNGSGSAADADEDIAYSLYLAHRKWGSGGTFNYKALADTEVGLIKVWDLDANRVKVGDQSNDCRYPSYFFPNQYVVFGKETNDTATWNAVNNNSLTIMNAANNGTTGLMAEQVNDSGGAGGCTQITNHDRYYYNSARVPFRLAMHYVYYGTAQGAWQNPLNLLANFFNGSNGGPSGPGAVVDCYNVNGSTCGSYNAGAFVGPAGTSLMIGGGTFPAKLQQYYDYLMVTNYSGIYFDGAISLLSLLLMSGNMPNWADPAANLPTPTPCGYPGNTCTPTITPTPTPLAFAYIFEDFENAILVNTYNYAGGGTVGASLTVNAGIINTLPQTGTFSDRIVVSLTSTAYYGGHGFDSSYAPASGVMNFAGSTSVRVGIRVSAAMGVKIGFREGNGVGGGDDETWESPPQTITQVNQWVYITVPVSSFTEGIYNPSCNPSSTTPSPCLTSGNNTFNLGSIKAFEIQFQPTLSNVTVQLDNIAFLPPTLPTNTPTKTPFPSPFTLMYDDFESPLSFQSAAPKRITSYAHAAGGATITQALSTSNPLFGAAVGCVNYNLGTAGTSYGGGASFLSPYFTGSAVTTTGQIKGDYLDATGAVRLSMYVNAPAGLKYRLVVQESGNTNVPQAGADGEVWNTALLTGTGNWSLVEVDLNEFVEDPYNTICNPATPANPNQVAAPGPCIVGAQSGNNTMNVNRVYQVGIKLPGEQVGVASRTGSFCMDNVAFITSARTNTPTRTSTPGGSTFTSTRTPTASPTRTPSPSATRTHTLTVTRTSTPVPSTFTFTATRTNTPSVTLTSTSTPVPNTFTFTATRTNTPSVTRTHTLTATRTGTPVPNTFTHTPTWTPSATRTNTPSATRTFTSSHTRSSTPTYTGTPTHSPTRSPTGTATGTITPTNTFSIFTLTNTPVVSPTPTVTATSTRTATGTGTATGTASSTVTPSHTRTASPSGTPTGTASPTATPSGTRTITGTITPSGTVTLTPTFSIFTLTNTPVVSNTPTVTTTSTATPSHTPSVTGTGTPTGTVTLTSTFSIFTLTNTPVVSNTPTVTGTSSPTATFTATGSATPTSTLTATRSATPSVTPTVTLTATRTASPTALPTGTVTVVVPVVSSVNPGSGSSLGGTVITVTGSNFLAGAEILMDGVALPGTNFINGSTLTVTMPMHAPGTVNIEVRNPGNVLSGTGLPFVFLAPTATFTRTATPTVTLTATPTATATVTPTASPTATLISTSTPEPPVITGTNPVDGAPEGGYVLTIIGDNFAPVGAQVLFNGVTQAASVSINAGVISLVITAPAAPANSTAVIEVRNPDTQSSSVNFTIKDVTLPTPIIPQSTDVIVDTRLAPNPNPSTQWVLLAAAVDDIHVKVYTKAMMVVGESHSGPVNPGWNRIAMPAGWVQSASSGLYYVVVTATRSGKTYEAPKVGKCMVIR